MQIATETERKYDVPDDFALPPLPGAGDAEAHDLDATYYDTDDLRLARNRRTLRRRTGGTDAGWHLKTPGDGSSRTEHRLPIDGDEVPGEMHDEVRVIVRDRPLQPVARLRTRRLETPLRDADGRTLALIAQDRVTAETGGREQTWQEVEAELVEGDPELLEEVERHLLAAGARPAAGPSKLARALGDRLPPRAGAAALDRDAVHRYVREQRDALAAYDPGVRAGDAESVHKMRVATRRLRSTLRTFKRSFPPGAAATLGPELKWLAAQLGEVRDGQVLEGKLLAAVDQAGPDFTPVADRIRDHLEAKVAAGREALRHDLNGERYLRLLDAVDDLVERTAAERKPVRRAGKALAKADGLLAEAMRADSDEELHAARKAYKKARYAVEVFAPGGGKPARRLVKRLTELQDVLGAHQDSVVAREVLRDLARDADDGFPYGVLYARQEQIGRDTLRRLPAVVAASGKPKLRGWLGGPAARGVDVRG
ncbi:CYTH and CHAD domain-containing protein [Jidongwangia harbinensis]|uniref:CYTH and CHAD domain-containing protein n=1 Tax=Jidongwangia harbinensis TaxID=2878561 RepID=UPI001CD92B80|nr:CYTH and CHAD domain-containing protein [Jidongwangia harbinensis]MCA2215638.1 CYTH and CHAD domain-containing protein [Jidongwangia harbinensis]